MEATTVAALGFFDGVHWGHLALLSRARSEAQRRGCASAALSFDRHPLELLCGMPQPLLTPLAERERLLRDKVDQVCFLPFDRARMEQPWQAFFEEVLLGQLHAVHLVCGYNYRFGHGGEGTAQRLREACLARGIGCDVIGEVTLGGVPVSSTAIRAMVASGDVARAARFLSRPYRVRGTVVHGNALGRTLGTPTANLQPDPCQLLPGRGVYITRAHVGALTCPAVTNVGIRPTVDRGEVSVEAWLLDFEGDLYGQEISLDFCEFLRPERKFDSLSALQAEIQANAAQTRAYFSTESEVPR